MISAKIIGAGGYGGLGIIELLLGHPEAEIAALVDVSDIGKPISELYPHLRGFCDLPLLKADDPQVPDKTDVVFMATPDRVGMSLAEAELAKGAKVIDYSGDFRFNTKEDYVEYASRLGKNTEHNSSHLLPETVYGLAELHRSKINLQKRIVGNPGCFAVSCILGFAPAVKNGLINTDTMICDCKTGVSGAGKKPAPTFHYPARHENMNAYKLKGHQHVCEIERELGILGQDKVNVAFTAQVVPVCRGIMSSLYAKLQKEFSYRQLLDLYKDFYSQSPFIRVLQRDDPAGTAYVRGTNYCDLVIDIDEKTNTLRIISYIDNLLKGQSGSALQNMNLLFGLDETTGLNHPAQYP
jgi:N-acetyl-gamma-glutamyl-phosphate reductase